MRGSHLPRQGLSHVRGRCQLPLNNRYEAPCQVQGGRNLGFGVLCTAIGGTSVHGHGHPLVQILLGVGDIHAQPVHVETDVEGGGGVPPTPNLVRSFCFAKCGSCTGASHPSAPKLSKHLCAGNYLGCSIAGNLRVVTCCLCRIEVCLTCLCPMCVACR